MNKKNLRYEKYFKNLNLTLNNLNNKFLYYIPSLYKKDLRKDKISIIKVKFSFISSLFRKSYLIEDLDKVKKSKICFISHYVGNKINDQDYDFYYGNLFKRLEIQKSFYVILINHTNESLSEIRKKFKNSKISRAYVNNDFNIVSDSLNLLKISKKYLNFKIFNLVNYNKFNVFKKLNLIFDYKFFLSSRYTYKISNSIKNILGKSENLENLVTTFEGHAFEKIIFNYCKNNKIKSFGYFFSVIREYKNSIYYKFNQNYQPDVVLTSGTISKNDLQLNSPFKNIKVLGCNKSSKQKKKFNIFKNKSKKITILVCPEGLFSETLMLLKLINSEELNKKEFKFIFRTHPLINISRDFETYKMNNNIHFSKEKDIKKDFNKSDIILYSGSSVCIQATVSGLIPINFKNNKSDFSFDPLYKLNKFIVNNAIMLLYVFNEINKNKSKSKFKQALQKIQNYAQLYFQKLNVDILINSKTVRKKNNI